MISKTEILIQFKKAEIIRLKEELTKSDFTVLKICEAQIEGNEEEVANLKTKYADDLAKRKEARARINELEALIASLEE